jgi:hypothetical protein
LVPTTTFKKRRE